MPEEVGAILDNLESIKSQKFGDFELFSGEWKIDDKKFLITTAWSGWGKVSSSRATVRLISNTFNEIPVEIALFTGVAGAVDKKLKQWDVVLSEALIQHDMDARPLFEKYVIPALNSKKVFTKKKLIEKIFKNLNKKLKENNFESTASVYKGLIATGDMFISDNNKINQLSKEIPELLAVEMEGAAFAQVCHQEKIDWIVMRVISDGAVEDAHEEFSIFLKKYKFRSCELIKSFLVSL